jgi:hypothetical protein
LTFGKGEAYIPPSSALSAHGVIARYSEAPHWISETASDGYRMRGASTASGFGGGDRLISGLFEK